MTVLADTSVWVRHWRHGDSGLVSLLESNDVAVHPFVIGELALGALNPRATVLTNLRALRPAAVAEHEEVLALVDGERLWGRGIGWVDCHLLASARLDRLTLWTLDAALARAAARLGVGHSA